MTADDYYRSVDIDRVIGETIPVGRELSQDEIGKLLDICEMDGMDGSPAGLRDAALISLMYSTGLRRAEVSNIMMGDYNPEDGSMLVNGKRNKQRVVYLTHGTKDAMDKWLTVRGDKPGAVFLAIGKTGKVRFKDPISPQSVYTILRRRGKEAGLTSFSPHDMRRSFATSLLENGADIAIVSSLMGHSSISTTIKYDKRGEAARRKVAGMIRVP